MPPPVDFAAAVRAFDRMLELQNPDLVQYWNPPASLRGEFIELAETVVYALDALRSVETQALHEGASVETRLPRDVSVALQTRVRPREAAIWDALNVLDPDNSLLRELMVFQTRPAGRGGGVRATFEQGVEQVRQLIERNAEKDFAWLHPDLAESLLESKLLAFEPDAWLDRAAELEPVRTVAEGPTLPIPIRLRLRELFKVYTFGCWFAAVSAARATLEFALIDNAPRLSVPLPASRHADQSPNLSKLIQAYAAHTPDLTNAMERIRELGNLSLHGTESAQRGRHAAEAVSLLQQILSALYAREA
jgi:hypothetical protein